MPITIDTPTMLIALATIIVVLIIWVVRLEVKIKRMVVGKGSISIEDSIVTMHGKLKDLAEFRKELELYLTHVEKRLKKSIRAVETLRFNPFQGDGTGSNQSFATALLNEDGDGVVISSLYSRDRVSVYSKPVRKHTSVYDLSEEEKDALEKAKVALVTR